MGKLIITRQKNRLLCVLFDDKKPYLMETTALPQEEGILGRIFLAKVKDVVHGINAAFLSVSNEQTVYLSLADCKELLCTNRPLTTGEKIRQGDELVIQISGEALKTKQPTASTDFTLTGQYLVCRYWGHGVRYSKKLTDEKKKRIEEVIRNANIPGRKKYQFTVRTNAENLTDFAPLLEEMSAFIQVFDAITDTCRHRTCYTCFYKPETEIVRTIRNLPMNSYEEIVTDEADVCSILKAAFPEKTIRFYQDEMLSLGKLYSIDTHLKEALSKKVWLSCGGYLVIEPTEAMVVIDVNSGKMESKRKKSKDYFLKINLEAAKEVARQLRLRNYSGMIMVDFINMESEEDNQKLLACLDAYLKEDKIRTRLVDMTALGIIEITRKKVSKPLGDFFEKSLDRINA